MSQDMTEKPIVSIVKLDSYDNPDAVSKALTSLLSPWGGIGHFVKPGQRVLLKPNLVAPAVPERAVTTHPAIVRAVIQACESARPASISLGDGPGVGTTTSVAKASGLTAVLGKATIAEFDKTKTYHHDGNTLLQNMELTEHVANNDVLITLPKLKTHSQMAFTCAIKNQFGLIPGMAKAQFHFRFQNPDRLADLIVDINRTANPALAIVDAVVGMEGPGPNGGTPRQIGLLIAGDDLAAVDTVASAIIGLKPEEQPILMAARRANFGKTDLADIDIRGESLQDVAIDDYDLIKAPANILRLLPLPRKTLKWLRNLIVPRPQIILDKCIKCMRCKNGCPIDPPAIDPLKPGEDKLNHVTCIRCYCCHEFCPVKAIDLKKSRLDKWFHAQEIVRAFHRLLGRLALLVAKKR